MEEDGHQHRCHDGIDEEQGAGDAGCHVVETHVERGGGEGKHAAQKGEADGVTPFDAEMLSAKQQYDGEHHHCQEITIGEHRTRRETVLVEFQRAQWIGAITNFISIVDYFIE